MEVKIPGYEVIDQIGNGAYGTVYKTKDTKTGEICCTKVMSKKEIKKKLSDVYVQREINILKTINHPNCLKYISDCSDKNRIYLTTEFIDGISLDKLIQKQVTQNDKGFSEETVQHIMKGILNGLTYLHDNKILHRDLKPENIMIIFPSKEDIDELNFEDSSVKIVDFGFARSISDQKATSNVGSTPYKDPGLLLREVMSQKQLREVFPFEYDQKVDIWSLGILCYELVTGQWTFEAEKEEDLKNLVKEGTYRIPVDASKEFATFLNGMLVWSYEKRLTAEELSNHPFLTKSISEFQKINPSEFENTVEDGNIIVNAKEGLKMK